VNDTSFLDWVILLVPIILGSGGFAALITYLYNVWAKKREELVNMSQFRMRRINKKYNDYLDLILYSMQFSVYLDKVTEQPSTFVKTIVFFSLLKYLQTVRKITDHGSFLLSDQDAETVISELTTYNLIQIRTIFTEFDYPKFQELNSNIPLHQIGDKIEEEDSDYKKYCELLFAWITNQENKNQLANLKIRIKLVSQLLNFELNTVYEMWYGEKFFVDKFLSSDTKEYLFGEQAFGEDINKPKLFRYAYPSYYKRIFHS